MCESGKNSLNNLKFETGTSAASILHREGVNSAGCVAKIVSLGALIRFLCLSSLFDLRMMETLFFIFKKYTLRNGMNAARKYLDT